MECHICLQNKNSFQYIWNCMHTFCSECCETMNNNNTLNCPICRNNNILFRENHKLLKNVLCIDSIKKRTKLNDENFYISMWKRKQCNNENHTFIVRKIYGVIVICETCNLIDCFNYTVK